MQRHRRFSNRLPRQHEGLRLLHNRWFRKKGNFPFCHFEHNDKSLELLLYFSSPCSKWRPRCQGRDLSASPLSPGNPISPAAPWTKDWIRPLRGSFQSLLVSAPHDITLYNLRTNLKPSSTWAMIELESEWTFSVKYDLSMVIIWETLITLSLDSFDFSEGSKTLPGAATKRIFDVITTAIIVLILLSLNSFDWIISTGLR